ncbi:universal stress protein [Halomonas alkaliantarctica]|nr:universal stress protein [Halomonas alkaliantarctica]
MYQKILVPVDGSENAQHALEVACQLAKEQDTALVILHVPEILTHEATLAWGIGTTAIDASRDELEKLGEKVIEHASNAAKERGISHLETVVEQGDPARTIIDQAKQHGVDAIVIGSRGLSDLKGLVVGSVSHKVSHSAPCRVITVSG